MEFSQDPARGPPTNEPQQMSTAMQAELDDWTGILGSIGYSAKTYAEIKSLCRSNDNVKRKVKTIKGILDNESYTFATFEPKSKVSLASRTRILAEAVTSTNEVRPILERNLWLT